MDDRDDARALADTKDSLDPRALCSTVPRDDAAAQAAADLVAAMISEARSHAPDYAALVDRADALARRHAAGRDLDWVREGLSWDDQGVIHLPDYE